MKKKKIVRQIWIVKETERSERKTGHFNASHDVASIDQCRQFEFGFGGLTFFLLKIGWLYLKNNLLPYDKNDRVRGYKREKQYTQKKKI